MIKNKFLSANLRGHITDSQFRSYDFLPRIAYYLFKNKEIKSTKINIETIPDVPVAIWWVDNFGNCKTTILAKDIYQIKKELITKFGTLPYFLRLKDVPDKKSALITGSSGLGEKRFLEIITQGSSVSDHFNLHSGDLLTIHTMSRRQTRY